MDALLWWGLRMTSTGCLFLAVALTYWAFAAGNPGTLPPAAAAGALGVALQVVLARARPDEDRLVSGGAARRS